MQLIIHIFNEIYKEIGQCCDLMFHINLSHHIFMNSLWVANHLYLEHSALESLLLLYPLMTTENFGKLGLT